ncbi:MAG: electron transfer flavoprotein, partial [Syntrophomonadaceae bacterium]|nr:electron transfer flavoprotein [Syntrophomonadaceae bacterium]
HNGERIPAPELLDRFKARPEIARLIKGGQTAEYSAHVVPEGGLNALSQLTGNGILLAGDAAGFSMNIGITVRGMEYALASGVLAGQAVIAAKESGDYSEAGLAGYKKLLDESFVMQDFKNFSAAPDVLETPRFFNYYPKMMGDMMRDIYHIPADGPKQRLYPTMKQHLGFKDMLAMGKDMWKVRKI